MSDVVMQREKKNPGITGSTLKIIAMATMLIDHIGATVLLRHLQQNPDNFDALGNPNMTQEVVIYYVFRGIGRLAFPIFIFLLIEGFSHTKNRFTYVLRLLLFAVISEIPFDMAFNLSLRGIRNGHILEFTCQNIFFTLSIGLAVLIVLEGMKELRMDMLLRTILEIGTMAFAAGLAEAIHTDYGAVGVLAICIAYLTRERKKEQRMAAPCIVLALLDLSELYALADAGIVHFYNGERGWKLKWVFYIFYPLHLLMLAGICVLLFS